MRNAEPFVRAAVESVLSQACVEVEVIVVDDGSTDRSAEVVRSIADDRIRIIHGPQRGISAAFNAGLAEAKGEFLARCDADDLYPLARLAFQAEFLEEHPDAGAVNGVVAIMTPRGKEIGPQEQPSYVLADVTDELRCGKGQSHMCAYLFRTDLLRQIRGCREFFVTAEDVDLQLRLSEITRIWHQPRPAYLYRLHDASITHLQKQAERRFYEQCAREFQQQRLNRPDHKDDLDLGHPPSPPQSQNSSPVSSREQIQKLLLGQAWAAHKSGHRCAALSLGFRAWMWNPLKFSTWRSVLALAVK